MCWLRDRGGQCELRLMQEKILKRMDTSTVKSNKYEALRIKTYHNPIAPPLACGHALVQPPMPMLGTNKVGETAETQEP